MKSLREMFKLFVMLSFVLVLCAGCTFNYHWVSLGPFETSGAIRHIIVDPVNSNRLYVAAENGGVWVLDDVTKEGASWKPLSDQLENLQMRGIAKSSQDANYIVTANALGFVYHTTNHGQTWERVTDQNFQYVRRILIEEGQTKILVDGKLVNVKVTLLWVAARAGLYRIRLHDHEFVDTTELWPAGDGTRQRDVLDVAKQPSNSNVLFIGVRNSGVWKTQDGGASWSPSADWTTFGDSASQMIKLAINDSRVVAKMGRNVIINDIAGIPLNWVSTTPVPWDRDSRGNPETGGSDIGYRGNYSGKTGEWAHAIAIHPTDANTLVAGQASLFLSTDGGRNWDKISRGHEDIQSLTFSSDGDRLYIANDGGVFQHLMSNAINVSPADLNKGLTTMQFFRVGINGAVAVGNADHQGIRGTADINANQPRWTQVGSAVFGNDSLENDFVVADPHTPNRFFVEFQEQFLLRLRFPIRNLQDLLPFEPPSSPLKPFKAITRDGAVNNQLNYPVGTVTFDPRNDSNIILTATHEVLDTSFSIRMTRNGNANPTGGPNNCGDTNGRTFCFNPPITGSANWILSYGPVTMPIVSIAFSPTETKKVFALDQAGSVIVKDDIDDNPTPWRAVGSFTVDSGDFARQIMADIATPGKLYAMSHRKFMVSNNGGATWTQFGQASLQNAGKFNCIAVHPTKSNLLYLATDTGVFVSSDNGSTWTSIDGVLPNAPVMQVMTDSGYLYAVTFGRGLWRAKLP